MELEWQFSYPHRNWWRVGSGIQVGERQKWTPTVAELREADREGREARAALRRWKAEEKAEAKLAAKLARGPATYRNGRIEGRSHPNAFASRMGLWYDMRWLEPLEHPKATYASANDQQISVGEGWAPDSAAYLGPDLLEPDRMTPTSSRWNEEYRPKERKRNPYSDGIDPVPEWWEPKKRRMGGFPGYR